MLDLYNRQYTMKELKEHIYAVNLLDILKTQKITSDFALKYILNKNFQLTKEEESITMEDVFFYQPHLRTREFLINSITCLLSIPG
jgi:hypothetical protein